MIVLWLVLVTVNHSDRIEKLQNAITRKVVVEIDVEDRRFYRIWQTLERHRWEKEKLHWIILDSLSQTDDPERIFHLVNQMRMVDSIYTRKITELQDSLFEYIDSNKAGRFIIIRDRIGNRIKAMIREIRAGED
ncbi:MAG TPA: hypothetical protein EYP58_01910 [bacterium (Candidatus Stahlbacteria)]|nr:hypothetical protein [Candidatus Stahlbacteria bacterium]